MSPLYPLSGGEGVGVTGTSRKFEKDFKNVKKIAGN